MSSSSSLLQSSDTNHVINGWAGYNGVVKEPSLQAIHDTSHRPIFLSSVAEDTLSSCSCHSDYKQNLEQSAQLSTFSSGSTLNRMCDDVPLMTSKCDNFAFVAVDVIEDDTV